MDIPKDNQAKHNMDPWKVTSSSIKKQHAHELLQEIETKIFDGALHDIIEVTYAYDIRKDGTFFNKTIFTDFVNTSDCQNYQAIYELVMRRLEFYLHQVETYQQQLTQGIHEKTYMHEIAEKYLNYVKQILQVVMIWLPFEIEKAGYKLPLPKKEIEQRVVQLEWLEKSLFGNLVREDVFELSRSAHLLQAFVEKNEALVSIDERKEFLGYIDLLKASPSFRPEVYNQPEEIERIMNTNPLFQQPIKRETYVRLFELTFAYYGIDKPVLVDARSAVYDAPNALYIPDDSSYEMLKLQRVLELLVHEIETHYLIQENSAKTLGDLRGANNLIREEWLAKVNEEILNGATIADFDISYSIALIALGEILPGKVYRRFTELYRKLSKDSAKATGQFLRRKRNYPLNYHGVQHKDVSYSRWRFQVRAYLLNGGDYASLYYGKVDLEDMLLLSKNITSAQKKSLCYSQFLAERLVFELLGNTYSFDRFKTYLSQKYPFIDFQTYPLTPPTSQQEQIVQEMRSILWGG